MVYFWICTNLSPNSTGSENILIDKCSSTLFSYFILILLLFYCYFIVTAHKWNKIIFWYVGFGEKMSHKLATATFIKKKLLAITRKIAGAWKLKIPQKLATPTIIKNIYHRCPDEGCHFQNLIQLNQNGNPHSADGLTFVCTISKIGTFSIKNHS